MKHLDLFAGLGGFSFALDCVWYDEKNEHTFVEWEPFPQAVLRKHWPDAEIHGDIRAFVADAASARRHSRRVQSGEAAQREILDEHDTDRVDLLTGGFPCQPFSHAGRRKGTDDHRYLWPPMLEAITLFKPRWIIAENVRGFVTWNDGMVLETVCSDLEREGYEVWPLIIPAASVGAPHKRERIWIIANRKNDDARGDIRAIQGQDGGKERRPEVPGENEAGQSQGGVADAPDSTSTRGQQQPEQQAEGQRTGCDRESGSQGGNWTENWPEVATRLCTVDDGLPGGLVRPRGWRNAALKAAGNAIVPQVAIQIMRAIRHADVIHSDPSPTSGSSV